MNQKKKKTLLILGIIAGLTFQFIGISFGLGKLRIVSGICLTLYALLFSLCLNKLSRMSREAEFPEAVRQEEIELPGAWSPVDDAGPDRSICTNVYSGLLLYGEVPAGDVINRTRVLRRTPSELQDTPRRYPSSIS